MCSDYLAIHIQANKIPNMTQAIAGNQYNITHKEMGIIDRF